MRYKKKLSECLTNVNINHLQEFQKLYHMTFYIKEFLLTPIYQFCDPLNGVAVRSTFSANNNVTYSCFNCKARAGITEIHFLPFNPTDKRTALTYIDGAGKMHRVSKGAPEQVGKWFFFFFWAKCNQLDTYICIHSYKFLCTYSLDSQSSS